MLWPGYGKNSRVLEWMCERVAGEAGAVKTLIKVVEGALRSAA